jgi:hypothetical protein
LFGLKREDLGIIASSRATMYYMGSHKPVNIGNFRDLAQHLLDNIVIYTKQAKMWIPLYNVSQSFVSTNQKASLVSHSIWVSILMIQSLQFCNIHTYNI